MNYPVTQFHIPEEQPWTTSLWKCQDLHNMSLLPCTCPAAVFTSWYCCCCFHGLPWQATDVLQPSWLFVPPALDTPTLATRRPRAYQRIPHSSGGRWNLWARNRTGNLAEMPTSTVHFRDLLHAANLRHIGRTASKTAPSGKNSLGRPKLLWSCSALRRRRICDMGPTALLSFRRKACWGFFRPWTRELGYQRPAR
jgi:hypothetical protein